MVKIKDLDEEQIEKQLAKHSKIIKALRTEKAKRNKLQASKEVKKEVKKRVRTTGTITNFKIEKTNSSIYQFKLEQEDLDTINDNQNGNTEPKKQVSISKLITIGQNALLEHEDE